MIMLDYKDTRPLYEQVVEKFQTLILKGVLEPDAQLPSVRSLAVELSINPNTIQRAYGELERQGFIYTVKGRGGFVRYHEDLLEVRKERLRAQLLEVLKEAQELNIPAQELWDSCIKTMDGNDGGGRQDMIEIKDVTKRFGLITAVDHVSVTIKEGNVFGLIGTNGAGKSTVLRLTTGIYRPDEGEVLIDGMPVYDNREAKERFFFIPDEPYFFANANAAEMARYYASVYETFNGAAFFDMLEKFGLDKKRKVHTFSKGMKKQLALLLGIYAGTRYLLCDETFDGLDPVMRQGVKALLARTMEERDFTPVIASHNLRELEDLCDHIGLLHKGGVLLSKELEEMKCNIQKVQCVLKKPEEWKAALQDVEILREERRGALHTFTVRGSREMVEAKFGRMETVFFEMLPLSLEEIFISETEVAGYDVKKFLMDLS